MLPKKKTLLAAEATTMAVCHESVRGSSGVTSDDLTNLSWVAGTPVPMNTSVSPPEGIMFSKKINNNNNSDLQTQTHTENSTSTTKSMKRLFKAPLPTYKIIVRDHSDYSVSSNGSSPDRDDCAVIFANVMSEQPSDYDLNGSLDFDYLLDKVIPVENGETDDDVCAISDLQEEGVSFPNSESTGEKVKSYIKPNCSYTCLIGMALKASRGCLPVNAIYQYIEKEFPYFEIAPDGWKNSVRHNLSLNPIFRKVHPEGWFGKKGHLWEVCVNKQHLVNKEIQRYLHCTGKTLNKFSIPLKSCYTRSKLNTKKQLYRLNGNNQVNSPPVLCSRCTMIVSPTPHDSSTSSDDTSKQKETEKEVNKYCPDMKEEVKFCGIKVKPEMRTTESALDPNVGPLKYGGLQSPPNDLTSPEQMFSPMSYPVPFIPFYPQPVHFGVPMEETPPPCQHSSSSGSSTPSPLGNSMAAYAMPVPYQYMMWGHYAQYYNSMLSKEMSASNEFSGIPTMIPADTTSFKILSSSDVSADVLNGDIQSSLQKKRTPNQKNARSSPDVACLNLPPKRMKPREGSFLAASMPDKNISSYLADISSNDIFSDSDQATDDEIHHSNMHATPLPLTTKQQRKQSEEITPLSNLSPQEKKGLEKIVGDSDLSVLLTNGYKSITKVAKTAEVNISDDNNTQSLENKLIGCKEEVECVSSMDFHDIDSRVSSSQKDPYYLPRLDSLLHIGDDTIMSIKTAMNLDIQGTVEVRTANDKCKKNQEMMEETYKLKYNP